ncbi:ABC transporter ATP-binding protein [Romboutsia sp. 1001713B170207_170306_H8]|uniref:ABC transporter ATP-binding protein n=1 Tax=Romboutsia sp. 1001713B170207_170306_H8 TaxID=2787112 RepID=UPI00189BDB93|nr:ABC transporter ATP-binding protein [Romboutsia sp. 1001713B170207_170306_H8]
MAKIILENIKKSYSKKNTVIENLNLEIEDGSFTVLVGPSGCGKSTTLRMIAGLEDITDGNLFIGDRDVTKVDAGQRGISMVFQNYALYPHMSVKENIEFGLKNNKVKKEEREKLIAEVSSVVGLDEYLERKPSDLSGGQRQRVALARAMVKTPKVFLMDEPLSNLDAKLRNQMRSELIQLHNKLKSTFVYVTHDQVEAMSMADKIVIMNKGEIMQIDAPKEIYQNPKNIFVAQFIGSPAMNILDMNVCHEKYGFRPEKIKLEADDNFDGIVLNGTILTKEILGSEVLYCVNVQGKDIMIKTETDTLNFDEKVQLFVNKSDLYYFDTNGNRIENEKQIQGLFELINDKESLNEKAI